MAKTRRNRRDIGELLLATFEACAVETATLTEGGMELIISPRQRAYLRSLLEAQPDAEASGILDLLEADEPALAPVIELPIRDKSAGQNDDPTTYEFWYGSHAGK